MRVIIESPLAGDIERNRRYAEWICRSVWQRDGSHALASHLVCPHFLDEHEPDERAAGIDWAWFWQPDVPHWFFTDLGMSVGMQKAGARCKAIKDPLPLSCSQVHSPRKLAGVS